MDFTFSREAPWTLEDLDTRALEEPPPADFGCGAADQNQQLASERNRSTEVSMRYDLRDLHDE